VGCTMSASSSPTTRAFCPLRSIFLILYAGRVFGLPSLLDGRNLTFAINQSARERPTSALSHPQQVWFAFRFASGSYCALRAHGIGNRRERNCPSCVTSNYPVTSCAASPHAASLCYW
jgi:hypothetical protein